FTPGPVRLGVGEVAIPRRRSNRIDGAAQLPGSAARAQTDALEHGNNFSSAGSARTRSSPARGSLSAGNPDFSRCGRSQHLSRPGQHFDWQLREVPGGSAFFFPDYSRKMKENHVAEDPNGDGSA